MSDWVSVEDRLPEVPGDYLWWQKLKPGESMWAGPGHCVWHYTPNGKLPEGHSWTVTHWHELPEPPK